MRSGHSDRMEVLIGPTGRNVCATTTVGAKINALFQFWRRAEFKCEVLSRAGPHQALGGARGAHWPGYLRDDYSREKNKFPFPVMAELWLLIGHYPEKKGMPSVCA